LSLNILCLRTS